MNLFRISCVACCNPRAASAPRFSPESPLSPASPPFFSTRLSSFLSFFFRCCNSATSRDLLPPSIAASRSPRFPHFLPRRFEIEATTMEKCAAKNGKRGGGLPETTQNACLEALTRDQGEVTRVLSIQSHVVSGYAGNKCAIFPLQIHGFEVDFINSVQFSNHTAYKHITGQRLTETELSELFEGLKLNEIDHYSHVLTGYCGNPTFLLKIVDIVTAVKKKNPGLLFVCDPVLGDNGSYYTPKELMPIYRDKLIPMADVLTPNVFELQEITGRKIESEADCLEAIREMHRKGVKIVVVTSGMFDSAEKKIMHCYASVKEGEDEFQQYRFEIPVLHGRFVGTGDVFASLLVVWIHTYNNDIVKAVSNVISSIHGLLARTIKHAYGDNSPESFTPSAAQAELRLIQSRVDLLAPSIPVNYSKLS